MKKIVKIGKRDVDILLVSAIVCAFLVILDAWLGCAMDTKWGFAIFIQGVMFMVGSVASLAGRFASPD